MQEEETKSAADELRHQPEIGEIGHALLPEIELRHPGRAAIDMKDIQFHLRIPKDRGECGVVDLPAVYPEIGLANGVVEIAVEVNRRVLRPQDCDLGARLRRKHRCGFGLHLQKGDDSGDSSSLRTVSL